MGRRCVVGTDTGTEEDLWGVFGFSDDVWVVGGDADEGEPLILRWDGTAFTEEVLPEDQNPRGATTLFKVWGIDDQLWIVGQRGTLLARQGDAWVFQSGGAEANQDFVSLDGWSASDVVVVGGRGNARDATWDGTGWTTVGPSGVGGLNAVAAQQDGWLSGASEGSQVGSIPTRVTSNSRNSSVRKISMPLSDGAGRTYMVGGTFIAPHRGSAWVRTVEDAP